MAIKGDSNPPTPIQGLWKPKMIGAIVSAFKKSLANMTQREILWIVAAAFGFTVVLFVALGWLALTLFDSGLAFEWDWLNSVAQWFGGFAIVALLLILFPAGATLAIGLFQDQIAAAVEARDYPADTPGRELPIMAALVVGLKFGVVVIGVNLAVLPLYVLLLWMPLLSIGIYYGLNGYLLGREFYQFAALRHLDPQALEHHRRRNRGKVFWAGVVISFLFTLPLINLFVPVFASAFMIHIFKDLPAADTQKALQLGTAMDNRQ